MSVTTENLEGWISRVIHEAKTEVKADLARHDNITDHEQLLRFLRNTGIDHHQPADRIYSRALAFRMDPTHGKVAQSFTDQWTLYRRKVCDAVIPHIIPSREIDPAAYQRIILEITLDNVFTNDLWVNHPHSEVTTDSFPTFANPRMPVRGKRKEVATTTTVDDHEGGSSSVKEYVKAMAAQSRCVADTRVVQAMNRQMEAVTAKVEADSKALGMALDKANSEFAITDMSQIMVRLTEKHNSDSQVIIDTIRPLSRLGFKEVGEFIAKIDATINHILDATKLPPITKQIVSSYTTLAVIAARRRCLAHCEAVIAKFGEMIASTKPGQEAATRHSATGIDMDYVMEQFHLARVKQVAGLEKLVMMDPTTDAADTEIERRIAQAIGADAADGTRACMVLMKAAKKRYEGDEEEDDSKRSSSSMAERVGAHHHLKKASPRDRFAALHKELLAIAMAYHDGAPRTAKQIDFLKMNFDKVTADSRKTAGDVSTVMKRWADDVTATCRVTLHRTTATLATVSRIAQRATATVDGYEPKWLGVMVSPAAFDAFKAITTAATVIPLEYDSGEGGVLAGITQADSSRPRILHSMMAPIKALLLATEVSKLITSSS